jgi:protein phosphatase
MPLKVRWEAACEVGRVRESNEDAWGATLIGSDSEKALLVVADGMGGHPGGSVASHLAVDACIEGIKQRSAGEPAGESLVALFHLAKERLREHAEEHPEMRAMGTTLSLLLLLGDGGWVGHVGDSRILWIRDSSIALVTRDHSAAWERVEEGSLTVDEAERDPMGSLLTRHLGPFAPCEPDIFDLPLAVRKGDRLLLCSDGLGKVITLEQILNLTANQPLAEAVTQLVEETLSGGGPDNVTVLLAEALADLRPAGEAIDFDSLTYRFGMSP